MKLRHHFCQMAGGISLYSLITVSPVWAQAITGDGTLSTQITSTDGLNFTIGGGSQAGNNLFHSFSQFSVLTGGSAVFNNALTIKTIFARVTGGSASTIDGLLQTNGTASLFLLNPSGILFGPNAQLNVGGSFLATTANSLKFSDGTEFSATAQASPLLSVNVPIGLQYNGTAAGIEVQGSTLAVQPGQTLSLVGGSLSLNGATLTAPSGQVELASVAGVGTVELSPTNGQLNVPNGMARGDLSLTNGTSLTTSGAGGGNIQLVGRQINIRDARVEADTLGTGAAGNLTVNATDSVEITGSEGGGLFRNGLFTDAIGGGNGGDLAIVTGKLVVQGEARVSAATFSAGRGGNLTVNASDSVELVGVDPPVDPATLNPNFQLFTGLLTDAESLGNGGNLTINTQRLVVRDGAQISAATVGAGNGGNLAVNASQSVELLGVSPSDLLASGLFNAVQPGATGNAGNLIVNTGRLIVQTGAQIFAGTTGVGNGGNLTVNAAESVETTGVSPIVLFPSGLFSSADDFYVAEFGLATGRAGDLTVNTGRLLVQNGAQVASSAKGNTGQGGNLTLNAIGSIQVSGSGPLAAPNGSSALLSSASGGAADSGNITLNTGRLTVRDQARVGVNNDGVGNAGNVQITARSVLLDNQGSLTAATASGEGGNIRLQVQDVLLMRRNSLISAEAGGTGNGGNISLNTNFLVALENSDVIANAVEGNGGRIQISATGVLGTQFRQALTPESDITARSQAGINGTVEIRTPDIDPSRGTTAAPVEVVDVTRLVAQGCRATAASRFVVTGRGGLPPSPTGTISSEPTLADFGTISPPQARPSVNAPIALAKSIAPPIEAQGWLTNAAGKVVLTAQAPIVTPHQFWLSAAPCYAR